MTKQILCITYRDWALKIYQMLNNALPHYDFHIVPNKESYSEEMIHRIKPNIILWYGWSWILPPNIVKEYNCVALHPSPLPKYRGGSPLQNQIINGETISAITLFKMEEGLDNGDVIKQLPLSLQGNIDDIFNRMTELGFAATCDFLEHGYNLTPQDASVATYCQRRYPSESEITMGALQNQSSIYLYNKIRMLTSPYPNAFIQDKDGKKLYITRAHINGN